VFPPLDLIKLETLATARGYAGMTVFDNFSAVMLLSACLWLQDTSSWRGASYELSTAEIDRIDEYVSNAENAIMNASLGMIFPYAGATIPDYALLCDGTQYNKSDYPDLYDALDAAFIDTASLFSVPDLSDRFVYGVGSNNVGDTGGSNTHSLTVGQLANHAHSSNVHTHTYTSPVLGVTPTGGGVPIPSVNAILPALTVASGVTINSTGSGDAVDHTPPFLTLSYVIVAGK